MSDDRRTTERRQSVPEDEAITSPSTGVLLQMLRNVENADIAGHARNHDRVDALSKRLGNVETLTYELERLVSAMSSAKIDVSTQLYIPMRVAIVLLVSAATFAFVVGGGQWLAATSSTAGIREALNEIKSDQRNAATRADLAIQDIRLRQVETDKALDTLREKRGVR